MRCTQLILAIALACTTLFGLTYIPTSNASQVPFTAEYDESPNAAFGQMPRIELPLFDDEDDYITQSKKAIDVEQIIAEQNGKHVLLTHQEFPHMSVRIKRIAGRSASVSQMYQAPDASPLLYNASDPNAFCDPTVTSWSGYVDTIDGKSFFFYFFESRDKPDSDPILMWLTGGPGCASSLALFMELGPCQIVEGSSKNAKGPPINGTKWNPFSWNNRASIFFIDQPVEVGFSYSRYGLHTYNADQGAKDLYGFLRIFFSSFKRFQENDFIATGESYAGRYLPRYSSEILDQNHRIRYKAERDGKKVKKGELINLKKVAIGNGITESGIQKPYYYDFVCKKYNDHNPLISIAECNSMAPWKERCLKMFREKCIETWDPEQCQAVDDICADRLETPFFNTGRNPYNVLDLCKAGYSPNLCYQVTEDIRQYLDRKDVRDLLGAESVAKIGKFKTCNEEVASGFSAYHDSTFNNALSVAGLLERDIDVMIYVGKLDWICNHVGNRAWVDKLEWTGRSTFHSSKPYDFVVDGKVVGETQRGGNLVWATIEGAGHMVPHDKPKVALEMIDRFISNEKL